MIECNELFDLMMKLAKEKHLVLKSLRHMGDFNATMIHDGLGNLMSLGIEKTETDIDLSFTVNKTAFIEINDLLSRFVKS